MAIGTATYRIGNDHARWRWRRYEGWPNYTALADQRDDWLDGGAREASGMKMSYAFNNAYGTIANDIQWRIAA